MTLHILRPIGETFQPVGNTGTLTITGAPPQWGDEDSFTYSTHETDGVSTFSAAGHAELEPLPALAGVTSVRFIGQVHNLEGVDQTIQGGVITTGGPLVSAVVAATGVSAPVFADFTALTTPTAQEVYTALKGYIGTDPWYFAIEAITSMDYLGVPTPILRVQGAWVEVDGVAFVPLRKYPRDDGLGMSSAPRKFPPSKARRKFARYQ